MIITAKSGRFSPHIDINRHHVQWVNTTYFQKAFRKTSENEKLINPSTNARCTDVFPYSMYRIPSILCVKQSLPGSPFDERDKQQISILCGVSSAGVKKCKKKHISLRNSPLVYQRIYWMVRTHLVGCRKTPTIWSIKAYIEEKRLDFWIFTLTV